MSLALTVLVGFALGLVADVYVFGLSGLILCAGIGLVTARTESSLHACLSVAFAGLMLQLGFGLALAVRALWTRGNSLQAADANESGATVVPHLRK